MELEELEPSMLIGPQQDVETVECWADRNGISPGIARAVYRKPGGMTYAEAGQLSTPSARPGLRLLCLLVQTRNGETRSLPVHTLRPMPPRGVERGTGLYLREAHATRPPAKWWGVICDSGKPTPFVPIHEPFELVG